MSTMKNGKILLYFHFSKIIKKSGTIFQPPALSQKNWNCHTAQQYLTKSHFNKIPAPKKVKKQIHTSNITLKYCFICKINVGGNFIWKCQCLNFDTLF